MGSAMVKFFNTRAISIGTMEAAGIYCGTRRDSGDGSWEVIPDPSGDVICFPYQERGLIVNTKYRGRGKKFFQVPGGKKVFYGVDVLSDPQLIDGRAALVIVEGEMDYLSVQESGYPFVVSVPDGAPPVTKLMDVSQHDPEHDVKYSYIGDSWGDLKKIKRIVIATDADPPGQRLAQELVRRLGRARCAFVAYPDGCKDMNDVLMRHGPAEVHRLIKDSIEYHIAGLYTIDTLPPRPAITPVSTGFRMMDDLLKPYFPALMVVTGFAGNGKTTWTNQMVTQLAIFHGWKIGIASFEMVLDPYVTRVLMNTYILHKGGGIKAAREFIESNFVAIVPEETEDETQFDLDWLLDKAIAAVVRHGINVLVIDPWNEVEHYCRRGESLTEYTGRTLRVLKRFAKDFDVLVIVVAHPSKSGADKAPEQVSLYDVSDSAHFANKADLGVVVARAGAADFVTRVLVKKVRYQPDTGKPGEIQLVYDPESKTFSR